jgi:hypothetical protein
MSRNCSESILQAWHFSDNRPSNPGLRVAIQNFGSCMNILYWNLGQFTAQNKNCHLMKSRSHGRVTWNLGHTVQAKEQNIGVLVRTVYEAVSGYVCNMDSAERNKLEDTVLSLLGRNLGQNNYIYQDNFYNSVRLAQTLLQKCETLKNFEG